MSPSALLACMALLYGIANADPAVFTVTGADPDTAVSAGVAAGLKTISVSLAGLGTLTPGGSTSHANAGSAVGTTAADAEPFVADLQPLNLEGGPALNQNTGFIDGAGTFTPDAADITGQSLIADVSFTFGAELYTVDAAPVSEDREPSSREMIISGFIAIGLMPYLAARALLPQPALSAFTVQSK
jgi:hypothetical protein